MHRGPETLHDGDLPSARPIARAQEPFVLGQLNDLSSAAQTQIQVVWYEAEGLTSRIVLDAVKQTVAEASSLHYYIARDEAGNWWNVPVSEDEDSLFRVMDLSESPDPDAAFREYFLADFAGGAPIFGPGAPYRSSVVQVGPQRFAWYMAVHHASTDGWGGTLLRRRAGELIVAALTGEPAPDATTVPFTQLPADDPEETAAAAQFWLHQLEDAPRRLSFSERVAPPADLPHTTRFSLDGARVRALAQEAGLKWHDVMAGLAFSYLAAVTQEESAVVGFPVSRRRSSEEKTSHMTAMGTLPFRLDIDSGDSLLDVAARFRANLRASYGHQAVLLSNLRQSSPHLFKKSRIFGPLINIIPFHDPTTVGPLHTWYEIPSFGPVDDYWFLLGPMVDDTLQIELFANPNLYPESECELIAERFQSWVEQLLGDPTAPLSQARALAPREEDAVALLRNTPSSNRPTPTAPAWGDTLTASQLAEAASSAIGTPVTGVWVLGTQSRPTVSGEVGALVAVTERGEVNTGLLAEVSPERIVYRGPAEERFEVGEYGVEKGMILRAMEDFAEDQGTRRFDSSEQVELEVAGGSVTARGPWEDLSPTEKRRLRELTRAYTPARVRFA